VHVCVLVCVRVYCVFVCVYISAENFMSEREVIKMLDDLHQQKMHAESQAGVLQQQIEGVLRLYFCGLQQTDS